MLTMSIMYCTALADLRPCGLEWREPSSVNVERNLWTDLVQTSLSVEETGAQAILILG